jgi:hypothetical protein
MTDGAAFYGAAAGAIPLLYIALAVDERASRVVEGLVTLFMDETPNRPVVIAVLRGLYLAVVTAVLISGAGAAFAGLAHPEWGLRFAQGYTGFFVAVALAFGGGLLVLQPFIGGVLEALKQSKSSKRTSGRALAIALGLALCALYLAAAVTSALLS